MNINLFLQFYLKIIGIATVVLLYSHSGYCNGITNDHSLMQSSYWQQKAINGNNVIMDNNSIIDFNRQMVIHVSTMPDLMHYPTRVSAEYVRTRMPKTSVLNGNLYVDGKYASEEYRQILKNQCNVNSLPGDNIVRYAITVRRTNMREMPTAKGLYSYPNDNEFDVLQQTTLDPGEPVVVLHESANGNFYLVDAVNYTGWISKFDIAFTNRNEWLEYVAPEDFLVAIEPNVNFTIDGENINYQMGSKIPVIGVCTNSYEISIPVRKEDGKLQSQNIQIPKSDTRMHEGYLDYTANNLIAMALKWNGFVYGWGGFHNSVDCSSLNFNVLRTIGIVIPRDADQQEEAPVGRHINFANMGYSERQDIISKLPPGTCLYMPGHTLIYIGEINGVPYVIHALGSYYPNGCKQIVRKVVVSDLSLPTSNGSSMLMKLTSAVEFR